MPDSSLMQLSCQGLVDLSLAANTMILQTNVFRANNFDGLENINNTQAFSARAEGDQILMKAGGADIWERRINAPSCTNWCRATLTIKCRASRCRP